jgi:holo-[acyl-carrier protein] synthase
MLADPSGVATVRARTGCDLQSVGEVADAVRRFGVRYLERVYTPGERADCARRGPLSANPQAASLAARWAAKEAVIKLLGSGDGVDPRSIEIRNPDGPATVALTGRAAELAEEAGLGTIDVSLSHTGGLAMAVATALQHDPTTRRTQTP